jgi:hypothetical protein
LSVASFVVGDEHQLQTAIRRWLYVLYATMDDSHLLITAGSDPQS